MDEIKQKIEMALPSIARRIQNELIMVCPVDTGRLKNSIKVSSTEEGLLIWMVSYGKFIEFGTPPHLITPKDKQALKFKGGKKGEFVFSKKVKHPGSRPNPFIRNTIQNKLRQIIIEEISK